MDEVAFLSMLREAFQCDAPLRMDMSLTEVPGWDSLTRMVTIALAMQHFGKEVKMADLEKTLRIKDLYVLLTA